MDRRPFLALGALTPLAAVMPALASESKERPTLRVDDQGLTSLEVRTQGDLYLFVETAEMADQVARNASLRYPGRPYLEFSYWAEGVPHWGWGILLEDGSVTSYVGRRSAATETMSEDFQSAVGDLKFLGTLLDISQVDPDLTIDSTAPWGICPIVQPYEPTLHWEGDNLVNRDGEIHRYDLSRYHK